MAMGNDMNMQGKRREEAVLMAPIVQEDTLSGQIMRLHDIAKNLDDVIFRISNNLFTNGEPMKDSASVNCAFDALRENVAILEHAMKLAEGIAERL